MAGALLVLVAMLLAACGEVQGRAQYANLRGIRMYYVLYGRGKPLLLLHGGAGDGRQFSKQIPAFAGHYHLIVPDVRAQGRSTDGPGPLTYHDMAEDVVALMDLLAIRKADVMGWSDGAIIALDIAIHHPDRLDHLVSFGANFNPSGLREDDQRWLASASAESFGDDSRKTYERDNPDPKHWEIAMNKVIALWRTQPNFTLAELGRIQAHTLIAAGDRDIVQPAHTDSLARAIPHAKLWIVLDASHGAMLERPKLVNHVVLRFLKDKPVP